MKRITSRLALLPCAVLLAFPSACASAPPGTFDSPEQAVQRLLAAGHDPAAAEELLGPGGFELMRSGDDVADREDQEFVRALIREGLAFEDVGADCKIALLGAERWELPFPLVRLEGRWRFDVEAGREEVLNRRVGRNELATIATLRALVQAQDEYAALPRDGRPRAFARKLTSSPGQHDGLYWASAPDEPESPLGRLVAEAAAEGYHPGGAQPVPYHGYFFRLLDAALTAAPGDGAGPQQGYAVVAWPVRPGASGVMTFFADQQGNVYQRDLGAHTAQFVERLQSYDPAHGWELTLD